MSEAPEQKATPEQMQQFANWERRRLGHQFSELTLHKMFFSLISLHRQYESQLWPSQRDQISIASEVLWQMTKGKYVKVTDGGTRLVWNQPRIKDALANMPSSLLAQGTKAGVLATGGDIKQKRHDCPFVAVDVVKQSVEVPTTNHVASASGSGTVQSGTKQSGTVQLKQAGWGRVCDASGNQLRVTLRRQCANCANTSEVCSNSCLYVCLFAYSNVAACSELVMAAALVAMMAMVAASAHCCHRT